LNFFILCLLYSNPNPNLNFDDYSTRTVETIVSNSVAVPVVLKIIEVNCVRITESVAIIEEEPCTNVIVKMRVTVVSVDCKVRVSVAVVVASLRVKSVLVRTPEVNERIVLVLVALVGTNVVRINGEITNAIVVLTLTLVIVTMVNTDSVVVLVDVVVKSVRANRVTVSITV